MSLQTPMHLWVGGIPMNTKQETIRGFFEKFGTVEGVKLPANEVGKTKNFAFVTMGALSKDVAEKIGGEEQE